jgi:PatG Domain
MREQNETIEQSVEHMPVRENDAPTASPDPEARTSTLITPQAECATCSAPEGTAGLSPNGAGMTSYVYAIGRIETRFPNLAAEKEFAQATGRTDTAGKTDQQTFHAVLSKRENRYLVRQLCWVLSIQGLESYILVTRDPVDFSRLVGTIRSDPSCNEIDWSSACAAPSPR